MVANTAGYSGTPLPKKLGIKNGHRVALVSAPPGVEELLGSAVASATVSRRLRGRADVFLFFPKNALDLERRLADLVSRLEPAGGLWIAWPKKSAGIPTDLAFDVVQGIGLSAGLPRNRPPENAARERIDVRRDGTLCSNTVPGGL